MPSVALLACSWGPYAQTFLNRSQRWIPINDIRPTVSFICCMLCLLQRRKHINSQLLQGGASYADYVSIVPQLPSLEIEDHICHWDIATLTEPEFMLEYSPEQYPLLSLTRGDVQLVLNVAGQGAFSTSCVDTAIEFSARLLEALTVKGYEPEYEVKLLKSNGPGEN